MKMGQVRDLSGQRFGKLIAIEPIGQDRHRNVIWRCKCDCGRTHDVVSRALVSGRSTSCGCLETGKFRNKQGEERHGGSGERLYRVWGGMLNRCYDKNVKSYANYGGRGIKVCDEWLNSYASFREWAYANGYDPALSGKECSIDRIDNDGDYEPDNCRWVPMAEQLRNRQDTAWLMYRGTRMTLSEASRVGGIAPGTISARVKRGWSVERAVEQPARALSNGNTSRVATR